VNAGRGGAIGGEKAAGASGIGGGGGTAWTGGGGVAEGAAAGLCCTPGGSQGALGAVDRVSAWIAVAIVAVARLA
jgi:hypothetical protein